MLLYFSESSDELMIRMKEKAPFKPCQLALRSTADTLLGLKGVAKIVRQRRRRADMQLMYLSFLQLISAQTA